MKYKPAQKSLAMFDKQAIAKAIRRATWQGFAKQIAAAVNRQSRYYAY